MSTFVSIILYRVDSRVGQEEVGGGHMQSDMHMVAVVVGCTNALVGTGWSNFFSLVTQLGLLSLVNAILTL